MCVVAGLWASAFQAAADRLDEIGQRLMRAYPDHIAGVDNGSLVWRDGTRMPLDDGLGPKDPAVLLDNPDLEDMFAWPYPRTPAAPPPRLADPGRARSHAFFDKMYGQCREGTVRSRLVSIDWLPSKGGGKVLVTPVNGVAEKLSTISAELDKLPATMDVFLKPPAGTYNCRTIAGTDRGSAHGYGIAIDLNVKQADYWRWNRPDASGNYPFRNRVPMEVVDVFEKHGFIWGGRWYHYDTMHFEYRPEILAE